jgi:hypothetical protein
MIDRVSASSPSETPVSSRPAAQRPDAEFTLDGAAKADATTPAGGVPATPPPEVLYALDRAQSVLAELASRGVSMRISVDSSSKIHVALYDGDGHLIREVPPSDATGVLSGERPVGWLSS